MADPLESILGPRALPPVPPALYPATLAALRRARRWQRARRVAALVGGAAALVALMALVPEGRGPRAPAGLPAVEAKGPLAPATATTMEWRALEGPGPAAPAYRQAGDRYLDDGDPANAVRCYGIALTEENADISESDSYLLMAIKLARKKESEQ